MPQRQARLTLFAEMMIQSFFMTPYTIQSAMPTESTLNMCSERSFASPVSQHFFNCGKYEAVVQIAATAPMTVVMSIDLDRGCDFHMRRATGSPRRISVSMFCRV